VISVAVVLALFVGVAYSVDLRLPDPDPLDGPTTITARDGTLLARLDAEVDRRPVELGDVSDAAVRAVVAAEDARFYDHDGVDPLALIRAVFSNVRTGEIQQGGSTLTQQYVKNTFTGGERTFVRKVREAVLSIQLERRYDKDEIVERYLNTIYFGEGAYGIEAAADRFFGVPAAELDLAQAAALAQAIPAPSSRNAREDREGAERRRDALLRRMAELGLVGYEEMWETRSQAIELIGREPTRYREPYFVDHVRSQLTATYGEETVLTGALEVRTTLDPAVQAGLSERIAAHLPPPETGYEIGAAAIDPRTGDVLAIHGGRDFYGDTSEYSATDYAQVNLATSGRRQAGSTFKPFVLAAGLEEGLSVWTRYAAPAGTTIGDWTVRNAGGAGYGSLTLADAMARSVNTTFARLGANVGSAAIVDVAHRLGIRSELEEDITISLGAGREGPTVLDMTSAFASFANDGTACPARTILEVRDGDGRALDPPPERAPEPEILAGRPPELAAADEDRCYKAVHHEVARQVNAALERAVVSGTGRRADIGRPQAGKTGTTDGFTDAWFVGYTPDLSLGIWVGDPDERRPVRDVGGFSRVYGGTFPATIWGDVASTVLQDVEPADLPGANAPASSAAGSLRAGGPGGSQFASGRGEGDDRS
jgi:penicillin-binding protein 1A